MKKVFGLIMVGALALTFVACGNKAKEEAAAKAKLDSTRVADSIAMIQAKQQREADSIAKVQMIQKRVADSIAHQDSIKKHLIKPAKKAVKPAPAKKHHKK